MRNKCANYWTKVGIILSLALLLSGCVSYTEDMVISSDGSGVFSMNVGIEDSLLGLVGDEIGIDEFAEVVEVNDGLRLTDRTSYSDRGMTWMRVALEFDTLEHLAGLGTDDEDFPFIGEITLITDDDGNLLFERNLDLHSDEDQEMAFMFANNYWEFSIQFPGEIMYANTVDKNIDEETNTVTWIFSLASLMQRPQQMKATIIPPSNTNLKLFLMMVPIFLLGAIYVVIKRKKSSAGNV